MLRLLVKAGTNVNIPSQCGCTVASSVSVILGIVNIFKYFIKLGARTPPIVRVLAYMRYLRKN